MPMIPVTTTFIALFAITLVPLTGWVGLLRGKLGAFRGDGDYPALQKRIRIHGNLIENAPAMALVLGAAEILGMASWILWLAVCSFLIGRVMHYFVFDKTVRAGAMSLTQFPAALLGLWCLYMVYLA